VSIERVEPYGGDEALETEISRVILVWAASVFAVLTVLTHLAQIFGIRFSIYAILGVSIAAVMTVVVWYAEIRRIKDNRSSADYPTAAILLACCLFSVFLCLASYRPDTDDCFYVPNVVYYLQNPGEPMGFAIHYIESGGQPFVSYHRGSIPFEYVQGITAYVGHLHFLTIYYLIAPALIGFMIPLVWYYSLSRFVRSPRATVFGTVVICLCLLLMGGAHRSFGNFAFNRIFQGKTVVLAVAIPLFAALSVDYFRAPSMRSWLYLLALSTAMVGCTVAAAMLVPLLAIVLALAGSIAYVSGVKTKIERGFWYMCSLAYTAAYAVSILLYSTKEVGSESALNVTWPATYAGHLKFVLSDPAAIVFMTVGTIGSVVFLKGRDRRFLIAWFAATVVLYLNPLVAPFMIEHVTSPNIYWRLFYLLPFPLVIGLSVAAPATMLEGRSRAWRVCVPGALILLLLLAHLPQSSPSVFRSGTMIFENRLPRPPTDIRWPGYKVANLALTRKILEACPPEGTMLAPQKISTVAAMLTARYTHICYRFDGIRMWFETGGRKNESDLRMSASQCLRGRVSFKGLRSVESLVKRYPQINVVVAQEKAIAASNGYLDRFLSGQGFVVSGQVGDMLVLSRS
jgi:hypothetical protein